MMVMIRDGASVNVRNNAGWTPLIAAISAGDENTVRLLLDVPGIDLDLAENDGWTPLMFAANNNRLQIAHWLIERGANVDIRSRMGFSAQGIARDRNFMEVVALFKKAAAVRNRYLTALAEMEAEAAREQAQQEVQPIAVRVVETAAVQHQNQRQQQHQQQGGPAQQQKLGGGGELPQTSRADYSVPPLKVEAAGKAADSKQAPAPEPKKKSGWFW